MYNAESMYNAVYRVASSLRHEFIVQPNKPYARMAVIKQECYAI